VNVPEIIVIVVGLYAALGLLIGPALLFVRGPKRDHALGGSGRSVRLLLIPGSVAVWPVLLFAWRSADGDSK